MLAVMLFAEQVQNLPLKNPEWKKCLLVTSMNENWHFAHFAFKFHCDPHTGRDMQQPPSQKRTILKLALNLLVRQDFVSSNCDYLI